MEYSFLFSGDKALTVQFKNEISRQTNACVTALSTSLCNNEIDGVFDVIPTFTSVTVCYDCTVLSAKKLCSVIKKRLKNISTNGSKRSKIFVIPVCYDEEFGEDIKNVMANSGLSRQQVIEAHSSRDYLIYMLGFLPGFAYLGGMDERLFTPRLDNPRTLIPKGSVGIGGEQTGIYPIASPGGWQLIGRTPINVYDKSKKEPVLYSAGDYIRFKPIDPAEYNSILDKVNLGDYSVEVIKSET